MKSEFSTEWEKEKGEERERERTEKKVQHTQKVIGRIWTTVFIVTSTWGQNSKSLIISLFQHFTHK